MTVVHPIDRAWISTGGTGARNYDEFADDAEITAIVAANPRSALAVEMPHCAPESLGLPFSAALTAASARLATAQATGNYAPTEQVIALYRVAGRDEPPFYGIFAMVDTDEISTSVDEPGLVIRNEDVFIEKVRERVALAEATQHLLSPVLLLQTGRSEELHDAIEAAISDAGDPAVTDIDHVGRTHAVWPVVDAPMVARLTELASGGELVVADGNHRSLAAQIGGLARFLAVITTTASVAIQPYHRLVADAPVPVADLLDRLRAAGATVTSRSRVAGEPAVPPQGTVVLYSAGTIHDVVLPRGGATTVERLDHAVVERLVLGEGLGLEPGDKHVTYVGGDYPPSWLAAEVDAGQADLAVLIAAVTTDEFVAVNLARQKMPRKSTWFTPKARGGLVLADLRATN
jgi:uncharacterized protein (DUF1015 family)